MPPTPGFRPQWSRKRGPGTWYTETWDLVPGTWDLGVVVVVVVGVAVVVVVGVVVAVAMNRREQP